MLDISPTRHGYRTHPNHTAKWRAFRARSSLSLLSIYGFTPSFTHALWRTDRQGVRSVRGFKSCPVHAPDMAGSSAAHHLSRRMDSGSGEPTDPIFGPNFHNYFAPINMEQAVMMSPAKTLPYKGEETSSTLSTSTVSRCGPKVRPR